MSPKGLLKPWLDTDTPVWMNCAKALAAQKAARYVKREARSPERRVMLTVQNLDNQVGRLYVLSRLPGLAGHAHTRTVTAPYYNLVRLAPWHKSRASQGSAQRSLRGLLYF